MKLEKEDINMNAAYETAIYFQNFHISVRMAEVSRADTECRYSCEEPLNCEAEALLSVQYFCKPGEISDLLIRKCYYVIPKPEAEKEYSLFRKAMMSKRVAAIAEIEMDREQKLIALFPNRDCIIAAVLFYENEVNELPIMLKHKTKKEEQENLKLLISEHTKEFDWLSHPGTISRT